MTLPTQISIDPELLARIRTRASVLNISLSEYFRRLAARDLAESPMSVDRSIVFHLGASGGTDISRDKDRLIGEATSAGKSRPSTAS